MLALTFCAIHFCPAEHFCSVTFSDNFVGFFPVGCRVKSNKKTANTKKLFSLSPVASAITHIYQLGEWFVCDGSASNKSTHCPPSRSLSISLDALYFVHHVNPVALVSNVTVQCTSKLHVDVMHSVEWIKALMLVPNDQKSATNENVI